MTSEKKQVYFTVFTPTYNRRKTIINVYESLKRQTYKSFEWIVVDDGSTDETSSFFDSLIVSENEFRIIYVKKSNGGKMRANNIALKLADSVAFLNVDSDDYLLDDALEALHEWFIRIEDRAEIAGVSGIKRIVGREKKYKFDMIEATNIERRKYDLVADMSECYKTALLKCYPAPVFEDEKYLSPSIVHNMIARDGYKLCWYDKEIQVCEYLEDGLSKIGKNAHFLNNPRGFALSISLSIAIKNDPDYAEFQYYYYYTLFKDRYSIREISEMLSLAEKQLERMVRDKPKVIRQLSNFFKDSNIKKVAIYGLGAAAKKLIPFIDDIGLEVIYGIDRNPNGLLEKVYLPTDNLPQVDAIILTNYYEIEDIRRYMEHLTKIRIISLEKDILDKGLGYYFSEI